tara:strand:+ start:4570 stop:5754 length:1185 start_codon:yes stop_codon:yes gene_type:complete
LFEKLSLIPPDSILKIISEYNADHRPNKIDLGVGVYRDANGNTPVMSVIKKAEKYLLKTQESKAYIGLAGDPDFTDGIQKLMLGDNNLPKDRIFTIQTAGGSSSLRIATELLKISSKDICVWVSEPTWNNHEPILDSAGVKYKVYPYYDTKSNELKFDQMIECLKNIPSGDVVLMHACCHNPTGMDPSPDQWQQIIEVMQKCNLIPFIDNAYQGLANGLDEDSIPIRLMIVSFDELIISSSCSKNFGLYRDRVGGLTVISKNSEIAKKVRSNTLRIVRTMSSVPPDHGAAAVGHILCDEKLSNEWVLELNDTRNRLKNMRMELSNALKAKTDTSDFSHIEKANGMFSYLGISPTQVEKLKLDYGIYMEGQGRINVAGITSENIDYLADSVFEVL